MSDHADTIHPTETSTAAVTDEQKYLREQAVKLARDSGMTWAAIGKRHGISAQYAQQIYRAATWPTDVAQRRRTAYEVKLGND